MLKSWNERASENNFNGGVIRSAHASFSMTSLISSASNSGCAQKDAALEVKNFQELAERMKVLGKSVYALTN